MKTLSLFAVESIDHLIQPGQFDHARLSSPALQLVTDFKQNQPDMISEATPASDLLALMQIERSKLKLVVDNQGELSGIIHLDQLSDQAIMRRVALGDDRREIKVADLMRPRERIKALAWQQLQHCTIADVLNTLQSSGEQHCVVVDRESHLIRGVISAQDIARRLHLPVHIRQTPTFLTLFDSISA
ncbi:histidine kinase [Arsukibacterium sp. MJ3]|jgi:CBS domain containing-hemolysin-like protein|uniref:CBS domain-containing protein n=1 Tax=Arsukibacterium sp. MJ3 TaxID=1632859 RepID=UPI000626EFB5|nr:CBS domain-containing protein [Arsukibacterium sp. MJ3]KKO50279.1 histidine kinase [Arsukibacterium sp. MJ3]